MNEADKVWFQKTINAVIEEELGPDMSQLLLPSPHFVDFMRDAVEVSLHDDGLQEAGNDDVGIIIPKVYEMVGGFNIISHSTK